VDIRHGKPVDPDREKRLVSEFSDLIAVSANEALPEIKLMILDRMDDWQIGARPAGLLLCQIQQKLRPGDRMSRVMADGTIVPMDMAGGG
jgi:hypothetical protein